MQLSVWNDISYGMYVVTTKKGTRNVGCIMNTLSQITSENPIVSISLNKENVTNQILKETKRCAISILSEETPQEVIAKFGYFSSATTDKFENRKYQEIEKLPVIIEEICGYILGNVINIIDCKTHDIFLLEVTETKKISNKKPMTYRYYHEKLKGKAPKNAPTYIKEESTYTSSNKYKCTVCGYIYDDEKEKIKFEDLPADWKCPRCGVGKEKFIKINE